MSDEGTRTRPKFCKEEGARAEAINQPIVVSEKKVLDYKEAAIYLEV